METMRLPVKLSDQELQAELFPVKGKKVAEG